MHALSLRTATANDLAAINAIYNHYVTTSTCTFQYEPSTAAERSAWFAEHDSAHPVIVATRADEVLGWGALSSFRSRTGYRFTVETTVYVRHDAHRQGVGLALLHELLERAQQLGYHTVVAMIAGDQQASVALHQRAGFEQTAQLRQIGYKFGQWLDVIAMQRMLGPRSS